MPRLPYPPFLFGKDSLQARLMVFYIMEKSTNLTNFAALMSLDGNSWLASEFWVLHGKYFCSVLWQQVVFLIAIRLCLTTTSHCSLDSVRVSNELGRGDAKAVKFSIKVLISTSVLIGLFFWVLCFVFGNKIGYWVTNDEEVARNVADLSLLLAFSVLLNGIFPVFSG